MSYPDAIEEGKRAGYLLCWMQVQVKKACLYAKFCLGDFATGEKGVEPLESHSFLLLLYSSWYGQIIEQAFLAHMVVFEKFEHVIAIV